jgi:hypothetical protein
LSEINQTDQVVLKSFIKDEMDDRVEAQLKKCFLKYINSRPEEEEGEENPEEEGEVVEAVDDSQWERSKTAIKDLIAQPSFQNHIHRQREK